jgi:hypothetical protein
VTTLRIEHPISDLTVWRQAFDRFSDARTRAGVRHHRIHRPVGEAQYVLIDLDFDDLPAAERFLDFLRTNIWSNSENAPALSGAPVTRLLEVVDEF